MCPICSSLEFTITGKPQLNDKSLKIIRLDYRVVKCSQCGMYYINPAIDFSSKEWKYLYDEDYFPEMSKWYEKNRQKNMLQRFKNIEKYSSNKIINFLDVGCGQGHCLIEAEKRGWKAYGLDITDHRISEAKGNEIQFVNSSLTESKLQSNFFDVIYMDSVLEHVTNPLEYLSEIKRILAPGGILYIGLPNEDSLFNNVKKISYKISGKNISSRLKPFVSPYHVVGFNKNSLLYIVGKTGLQVKKLRNFACRLEFLRSRTFSKDYFQSLLLLPVYLLAAPFRKEVYLEVYARKI